MGDSIGHFGDNRQQAQGVGRGTPQAPRIHR